MSFLPGVTGTQGDTPEDHRLEARVRLQGRAGHLLQFSLLSEAGIVTFEGTACASTSASKLQGALVIRAVGRRRTPNFELNLLQLLRLREPIDLEVVFR